MTDINSYQIQDIYRDIGIDTKKLNCVMLETTYSGPMPVIPEEDLYQDEDTGRSWIDGYVAKDGDMHCTLLYGLMEDVKAKHIEKVLKGWNARIFIDSISHFDPEQEYYCIVAKVRLTEPLLEGHQRCELLPHINTFLGYTPHMTLAYIKKDDEALSRIKSSLRFLEGKQFDIDMITYDNNSGSKKVISI